MGLRLGETLSLEVGDIAAKTTRPRPVLRCPSCKVPMQFMGFIRPARALGIFIREFYFTLHDPTLVKIKHILRVWIDTFYWPA